MTRTQARVWWLVCVLAATVLSVLSLLQPVASHEASATPVVSSPVSTPAIAAPTTVPLPSVSASAITAAPVPSSSPTVSTSIVPAPAVHVPSGRPTELVIPSIGLRARIHAQSCPLVDGALKPATLAEACYYTAADKPYQLPGSSTSDLSVLAGHTWRTGEAVFNALYDWRTQTFRVQVGDELWLRTDASGDQLLVYRAVQTYTPAKGDGPDSLMRSTQVWGADGETLPGRLLTIACLQPEDLAVKSSRNIVIAWQYAGTRPAAS